MAWERRRALAQAVWLGTYVWIVSEELLRVGWEEDYGVAKMRIKYSSGRGDRLAASKGYGD